MKLALASPRGCICTFKIKVAKTYGGPCTKVMVMLSKILLLNSASAVV